VNGEKGEDAVRVTTSSTIELEYDTFGDPADPAVLLVMGFGTQLLGWDAEFCRLLAATGRHVIRYDNRDCGLSTKHDDSPVDLTELIGALTVGDFDRARAMAPYTLRDMAVDAISLLDELGIDRAHIVGSSMGAMIAQRTAIEFPARVLSLTSMSSSTGEPEYANPPRRRSRSCCPPGQPTATATSPQPSATSSGPHADTATPQRYEPWPPPATTAPTTRPAYPGN
jgi:pimeloyl-ACP methyl ester carboxylesterase